MTKRTFVTRLTLFSSVCPFSPQYKEMLCPTAAHEPMGTSPSKVGKVSLRFSKLTDDSSWTCLASKTGTRIYNVSSILFFFFFKKVITCVKKIQGPASLLDRGIFILVTLTRERANIGVQKYGGVLQFFLFCFVYLCLFIIFRSESWRCRFDSLLFDSYHCHTIDSLHCHSTDS